MRLVREYVTLSVIGGEWKAILAFGHAQAATRYDVIRYGRIHR